MKAHVEELDIALHPNAPMRTRREGRGEQEWLEVLIFLSTCRYMKPRCRHTGGGVQFFGFYSNKQTNKQSHTSTCRDLIPRSRLRRVAFSLFNLNFFIVNLSQRSRKHWKEKSPRSQTLVPQGAEEEQTDRHTVKAHVEENCTASQPTNADKERRAGGCVVLFYCPKGEED